MLDLWLACNLVEVQPYTAVADMLRVRWLRCNCRHRLLYNHMFRMPRLWRRSHQV